MAHAKATVLDVMAKLAKGECANFVRNSCQGSTPCTVVNGEPCDYFARYVKPLLDIDEIAKKYQREAKVSVGVNPHTKVIRKRASFKLDIAAEEKPAPAQTDATAKKAAPAAKAMPAKAAAAQPKPAKAVAAKQTKRPATKAAATLQPKAAAKTTTPAAPAQPPKAAPQVAPAPTPPTPAAKAKPAAMTPPKKNGASRKPAAQPATPERPQLALEF
jgi:hypothetical protein